MTLNNTYKTIATKNNGNKQHLYRELELVSKKSNLLNKTIYQISLWQGTKFLDGKVLAGQSFPIFYSEKNEALKDFNSFQFGKKYEFKGLNSHHLKREGFAL